MQGQLHLAVSSAILGDFDRAIAVCEAALARQDDENLRRLLEVLVGWHHSRREPTAQFCLAVLYNALTDARAVWDEKLRETVSADEAVRIVWALINGTSLHFFAN